jgi:Enoyl-(Acyl carrier protein) reductase
MPWRLDITAVCYQDDEHSGNGGGWSGQTRGPGWKSAVHRGGRSPNGGRYCTGRRAGRCQGRPAHLPSMLERRSGAFVFNSSAAALVAGQVRFGYQVAKAGLNALTRFMASRYGRQGIRANATLPFVVGGEVGKVAGSQNCIGRSGTAARLAKQWCFCSRTKRRSLRGRWFTWMVVCFHALPGLPTRHRMSHLRHSPLEAASK